MPALADWKYSTVSDLRAGGYGVLLGFHGVLQACEASREAVMLKVRCCEERRRAAARRQTLRMSRVHGSQV